MSGTYDRPMTHQEYLKIKYSSQQDYEKSVRRKKSKKSAAVNVKKPCVTIIDEDVDHRQLKRYDSDEEELYFGTKEEKPVITDIIDERPRHLQKADSVSGKWKAIGDDDDNNNNNDDDNQANISQNAKKTMAGKKAGLSDAKELKKELAELKKKNEQLINRLSDDISGRNAQTVFRDRQTGKIRELEKELKEQQEKNEKEMQKQAAKNAVYDRWSKGVVQHEKQLEQLESDLHEMSKPLARYKDDEDLDELLRAQDREDDPMLAEIRKKRENEKSKDPDHKQYPKYKGPPAPLNRFNIQPGYRWDGVNRSNGYEEKYFAKQADREAMQEESYHWSVQDM